MTIIAYDGKTVASDRQMTDNGLKSAAQKIFKLEDGTVIAVVGDFALSLAMKDWYIAGRPEGKCPCNHDKNNYGSIVVFKPDGTIEEYENYETPVQIIDPFMAWGSGRNYAMTALALGKSAEEAVKLACQFDVFCGMGFDSLPVFDEASVRAATKKPRASFSWPNFYYTKNAQQNDACPHGGDNQDGDQCETQQL